MGRAFRRCTWAVNRRLAGLRYTNRPPSPAYTTMDRKVIIWKFARRDLPGCVGRRRIRRRVALPWRSARPSAIGRGATIGDYWKDESLTPAPARTTAHPPDRCQAWLGAASSTRRLVWPGRYRCSRTCSCRSTPRSPTLVEPGPATQRPSAFVLLSPAIPKGLRKANHNLNIWIGVSREHAAQSVDR